MNMAWGDGRSRLRIWEEEPKRMGSQPAGIWPPIVEESHQAPLFVGYCRLPISGLVGN